MLTWKTSQLGFPLERAANLVEEAMDTASAVVFGQRPDSLARKRRARPVVPEQASLFSLS
jgi:hypothetical protein